MEKLDTASRVVCDAGPLIHLDELGCLDLLRDFAEVQVAGAVWQEVHRPSALRRRSVRIKHISALSEATPELAELARAHLLHPGELDSLRLLQTLRDAMFLTEMRRLDSLRND